LFVLGHQQAHGGVLGVHGKQLQVGHHALQFTRDPVAGLVAVDPQQEMLALGQVQRHRDAGAVAEAGLLLPQVGRAVLDVGLAVPDDGHALALAVLHHRVAARSPGSA
jgi:hypothetical protein